MEQTVIHRTQLGVAGQEGPEVYDADTSEGAGLVASSERVEAATPRRVERNNEIEAVCIPDLTSLRR